MSYSSTRVNKEFVWTLKHLTELAESYIKDGKEGILLIELPEPNFTLILQTIKNDQGINVWTDNWTSFEEIIKTVHIRVECTTKRLKNSGLLRKFKGKNVL